MVHSWTGSCRKTSDQFCLACPPGYEANKAIEETARSNRARVTVTHSVEEAASGADAIYTDVWASMGKEEEAEGRAEAFKDYQVNEDVVAMAKKDALVMHCLPAHRGQEITHEVLEGPQCIAFDQAENRLHVQKAIMVWLIEASRVWKQ